MLYYIKTVNFLNSSIWDGGCGTAPKTESAFIAECDSGQSKILPLVSVYQNRRELIYESEWILCIASTLCSFSATRAVRVTPAKFFL